jgi:hypothetical protein
LPWRNTLALRAAAMIFACLLFSPSPTLAQFSQQGPKLVGTGGVLSTTQGKAVALSGDGNTAIVGGPPDNSDIGAAWVFTRSNGVWTQQGNKLVGTGATGAQPNLGYSVALSADGNTAIVGAPYDGFDSACNCGVGGAWVFTRSNGVWTQQGDKLLGTGAPGKAKQGTSVALSADGASTPKTAGATATAAEGSLDNSIGNSQASGSTIDVSLAWTHTTVPT